MISDPEPWKMSGGEECERKVDGGKGEEVGESREGEEVGSNKSGSTGSMSEAGCVWGGVNEFQGKQSTTT